MDVEAPEVAFQAGGHQERIFRVAGSASVTQSQSATVTLVHSHATRQPAGGQWKACRDQRAAVPAVPSTWCSPTSKPTPTIRSKSPTRSCQTQAQPDGAAFRTGEGIRCLLPPRSVNRLEIQLA